MSKPKPKHTANDKRLRQKYGLTLAQWHKLFKLQQGICPICLKPILKPGNTQGKQAASVDHDHQTGRVRGLLHWKCNKYSVGRLTAAIAKRVAEYLASDLDGRTL